MRNNDAGNAEDLVVLDQVSKLYETSAPRPAVDRVSLTIRRGESVAIMGPSGSGKSTLLNLIAGLDRASAGSVRVGGIDVGKLNEAGRARLRRTTVGLIFQFFNLLDNLTVLENVAIPAELAGARRLEAVRRARELLGRLGLDSQERTFPSRLSGGQRQRVAVARALINDPALLLADEPTGALDSNSGEHVIDILRDLNRSGRTLVLVTHDPALAASCATRTVQLSDGRLRADTLPIAVAR
jgi:putative ABC transport system ATP-binding protein